MSGSADNDRATNSIFNQIWGQIWIKFTHRVTAPIRNKVDEEHVLYRQLAIQLRGDSTIKAAWHLIGGQAIDQQDD